MLFRYFQRYSTKRFPTKLSKREVTIIRSAEKEKIEKHFPLHPHFAIKSHKQFRGAKGETLIQRDDNLGFPRFRDIFAELLTQLFAKQASNSDKDKERMVKVEEGARSLLVGRNSSPKTGDDRSRETIEDVEGKLSRYRANDFHGRWTNCTFTLATRSMETTAITYAQIFVRFCSFNACRIFISCN